MSILYGFINLDGQPAEPAVLRNMGATLTDYKADAISTLVENNVALGFLNQYITEESHFDKLPIFNECDGLYFVCDAILDNRDELAVLLGLRLTAELSDSLIIYESYKKWGKDCTRYLLGDFAFVIYDKKRRQVQLIRDHMGKRLLYYRLDNHRIFFSTLIKPLVDPWGNKQKPKLNEQYLIYFLSIKVSRHEIVTGSTIYRDISYVFPASCLTVTEQTALNEIYWEPRDIRPVRRKKNSDFIEEFKEIYYSAVKCRLRADGEIGIFLSGGLDSSSVACIAASILRDQNRQLHTYTSVPVSGFTNWAPKNLIAHESAAVKTMQAAYPNMLTHFIDSKDMNALNVADRILHVFEQPYKFIDNSYWLYDIIQTASNDGCKVILSGCFGNWTVSYGRYRTILFEHFMRLRWMRFIKDFNAFCFGSKLGRKQMIAEFADAFFRTVFSIKKGKVASELVKDAYLKKYDVEKTLRANGMAGKPLMRDGESRQLFFHPTLSNQATSAMAKFGLASGIRERDPTGDKRVVEFCLKLPYECCFDQATGYDRGLIRRAMAGIVPENILQNRQAGQQAVDWLERLEPQWENYMRRFAEDLNGQNPLCEYLDFECINNLLRQHSNIDFAFDTIIDVRNIITIDNCKKFISMI